MKAFMILLFRESTWLGGKELAQYNHIWNYYKRKGRKFPYLAAISCLFPPFFALF